MTRRGADSGASGKQARWDRFAQLERDAIIARIARAGDLRRGDPSNLFLLHAAPSPLERVA